MKRVKYIAGLIICLAIIISLTGCATTNKSSELVIQLSRSGKISVNNKPVALSKLCDHLNRIGATPNTSIAVEIPPNTSQNTLRTVSSKLASGGFRKIIFKKPRTSTSAVKKR